MKNRCLPFLPLCSLIALLAGCNADNATDYNQGLEALQNDQLEKAEEQFRNAIDENEKFGEAHFNLGATLARQARALLEGGQEEESFARFEQAIESKERARELLEMGNFLLVTEESEREQLLEHLKALLTDWKSARKDRQILRLRISQIESSPRPD